MGRDGCGGVSQRHSRGSRTVHYTTTSSIKEVIENIIRRRRKDWIRRELLDWSRAF